MTQHPARPSGALSRREVLALGGALAMLGVFPQAGCTPRSRPAGAARLSEIRAGDTALTLIAQEQPLHLGEPGANTAPYPAWLYGAGGLPVLRIRRGATLRARLVNRLPAGQHTTIHWHGLRLPNAMDGVPYLTQAPVYPGQDFLYHFTPPDAGTFFFHPHCNTAEQIGRGLLGILIVEDESQAAFDDDIVCVLKDWRVGPHGAFLPFVTPEGAAKAGSFGTLRTVNAKPCPTFKVPASGNLRLRLVNADSTRISHLGLEGAEATVIAIDGNPVAPFDLSSWKLGPAMRIELALRTGKAGSGFKLVDYFSAEPVTLAQFKADGPELRQDGFTPPALPPAVFRAPDLAKARHLDLALSAGVAGAAPPPPPMPDIPLGDGRVLRPLDSLCLATDTFWSLNGRSWPGRNHNSLPPPLFTLERGKTVQISLRNVSQFSHPIHLHGHSFRVLSASKLKRPVHDADTVLVLPNERVEIGFVADNPGDWMIHCHIIEHQDTGMMGWFRVS